MQFVFLHKSNHKLREAWVFFVRLCNLKTVEHCIKYNSYFHEKVIFDRSNIDDIFFHEQCFFISFKKDVEIRSQKFNINLSFSQSLCNSRVTFFLIHTNFRNSHNLQPFFELFDNFIKILLILFLINIDNIRHIEVVEKLLIFIFEHLYFGCIF